MKSDFTRLNLHTTRLYLREISFEDGQFIVDCRNERNNYKYFKNPKMLTLEQHKKWFNDIYLKNNDRVDFLIFEKKTNNAVGVFCLDFMNNEVEISYILCAEYQKKGYMSEVISHFCYEIYMKFGMKKIIAIIHKDNISSIKLITNNGFYLKNKMDNLFSVWEKIPTFYFRVDANKTIGAGHLMRCLSIANKLSSKGIKSVFFSSDENTKNVIDYKYECHILQTSYTNIEEGIEKILEKIEVEKPLCLVTDSYYVNNNYFVRLKDKVKLVYIDDYAKEKFDIDVLINYNIYAELKKYKELYNKSKVKFIIGDKYVPMRSEFEYNNISEFANNVRNVFVSTGGADPLNITSKILDIIVNDGRLKYLNYYVIVGNLNPRTALLNKKVNKSSNITLCNNVKNMKELMCECDLAISAAGSTLYELAVCKIPTICFITADNQIELAKGFAKRGFAINVGDARDEVSFYINLQKTIVKMLIDNKLRENLRNTVHINENGCDRLVTKIIEYLF